MKLNILFYVAYPYYYPHFLPIGKIFQEHNHTVTYILSDKQNSTNMEDIAKKNKLNYKFGDKYLFDKNVDVIFFAHVFDDAEKIEASTIFLCHGTGTKQCGFQRALSVYDIVLVEGDYRLKQFSRLYPEFKDKLYKVGYSKLDSIINITEKDKDELFKKYKLDKDKKTILYAPTFFPSSIEKMSDQFPEDFKNCNIIIKPHYISLERSRYKQQRKKFKKWNKYSNCVVMGVDEYNLVPFLTISDLMISDESAAIFEFASLNKPVIINRFLKLRWSYYLNPKKLLSRMDSDIDEYRKIGENPKSYKEMLTAVNQELNDSTRYEQARLSKAIDICGNIDGEVSNRILNIILTLKSK